MNVKREDEKKILSRYFVRMLQPDKRRVRNKDQSRA